MSNQEQIIQRYLLGELSESDQVMLEQQYFSDRQMFELMVQVENDLADKYARGLLSSSTRDRFEKYYMAHPQRRERARFAEALAARVDENKAARSVAISASWWDRLSVAMRGPRLAWGFSIAVLLFAVLAGWFFIETRRLRQELAQLESERVAREERERNLQQQVTSEQLRAQQLSEELQRLSTRQDTAPSPSPERATSFATLVLSIGGTRGTGGAPALLRILSGTEQVRLQLNMRENNYARYQVVIHSAAGNTIFSSKQLVAPNKKINANLSVVIPSQRFTTGDYIFSLKGVTQTGELEDVNKSLVHVEKQ